MRQLTSYYSSLKLSSSNSLSTTLIQAAKATE